jgi:hypothetical protein
VREIGEGYTTATQRLHGSDRIIPQLTGAIPCLSQPRRARIRRLIVGGIGAGGLAQK